MKFNLVQHITPFYLGPVPWPISMQSASEPLRVQKIRPHIVDIGIAPAPGAAAAAADALLAKRQATKIEISCFREMASKTMTDVSAPPLKPSKLLSYFFYVLRDQPFFTARVKDFPINNSLKTNRPKYP